MPVRTIKEVLQIFMRNASISASVALVERYPSATVTMRWHAAGANQTAAGDENGKRRPAHSTDWARAKATRRATRRVRRRARIVRLFRRKCLAGGSNKQRTQAYSLTSKCSTPQGISTILLISRAPCEVREVAGDRFERVQLLQG